MSVTLAQVRTQIADRPQLWPNVGDPPELIGTGDGTSTIFSLRFENFIAGTLTIYTAPAPVTGATTAWTAVSATLYTVGGSGSPSSTAATNAIITFATAPASGVLIGARYQSVAFSDADLSAYLSRAQAMYSDDISVLKRCTFDLIDIILLDQRRCEMISQGDYKRDPAMYVRTLSTLKESLRKDLAGGPQPGANIPQLLVGSSPARRYGPFR